MYYSACSNLTCVSFSALIYQIFDLLLLKGNILWQQHASLLMYIISGVSGNSVTDSNQHWGGLFSFILVLLRFILQHVLFDAHQIHPCCPTMLHHNNGRFTSGTRVIQFLCKWSKVPKAIAFFHYSVQD